MSENEKVRVLLIGDLDNWILGRIAKKLSQILTKDVDVTVLISHSRNFHRNFFLLQSKNDVVHFLSPWDYFRMANITYKPCITMLWHMVDWTEFDKNCNRLDTLCVGSQQWFDRAKHRVSKALPIERAYYGLDSTIFKHQPLSREKFIQANHIDDQVLIFGFAGSAWSNEGERKGLDRLWDCLLQLKKQSDIPFLLRIIGRHWTSDIIPEELRSSVRMDLDLPDNELPDFYSSLDYYVCLSRVEGVPYPVIEAMSCECVVLSTLVGVAPEILEHGKNGFLLQGESIERDFLNVVLQTSADLDLKSKIGLSARTTILRKFSWESIESLKYKDIYERCIVFFRNRPPQERIYLFLKAQIMFQIESFWMATRRIKQRLKQVKNNICIRERILP